MSLVLTSFLRRLSNLATILYYAKQDNGSRPLGVNPRSRLTRVRKAEFLALTTLQPSIEQSLGTG